MISIQVGDTVQYLNEGWEVIGKMASRAITRLTLKHPMTGETKTISDSDLDPVEEIPDEGYDVEEDEDHNWDDDNNEPSYYGDEEEDDDSYNDDED